MTSEHLSTDFGKRYHSAPPGMKVVTTHRFGIAFADRRGCQSLKLICADANMPTSYATEHRKGLRLAEFVTVT